MSGNELAQNHRTEITRTGEHTFRVPSRTAEGRVYTVDIERNFCTCRDAQINKAICSHQWAAAAVMMELELEPEYVIEKNPNVHYLYRHDAYMLVEVVGGERRVVGYRPSWIEVWMDRLDLEGRVA